MTEKTKIESVPLLDLKRQYAAIGSEMERALLECSRSTQYILGKQVESFEQKAGDYCGAKHALGVTSGSDALIIALMAEKIGHKDKVITTPFTFFATAGAISRVGAEPVFVDIEPDGFNINPEKLEKAASSEGVKAVIPVHLFGQCAQMDAIMEISEKYGLAVIEDAAQAIGAEYKNRRAGSIGHYGCFSFFPSKNLGCIGDGGLVTTNDQNRADKLRILRNHGARPKYYHNLVGGNFRLDAVQAAVLSIKLPYLDSWTEKRQSNAAFYRKAFEQAGLSDSIVLPPEIPDRRHIYNQFTVRIKNGMRDRILKTLREKKIGCEIYYPVPLHLQECFESLGHAPGDFPVSEAAANEVVSLPIFPELSEWEMQFVVDTLSQIVK